MLDPTTGFSAVSTDWRAFGMYKGTILFIFAFGPRLPARPETVSLADTQQNINTSTEFRLTWRKNDLQYFFAAVICTFETTFVPYRVPVGETEDQDQASADL